MNDECLEESHQLRARGPVAVCERCGTEFAFGADDPPESPSLLLQRAADRLEELSKQATKAPWEARSLPGESTANVVFRPPWSITGFASLFNSTCCNGNCWGHVADENDAAWIAALSPAVAGPIAAMLRWDADRLKWAARCEDVDKSYRGFELARLVLGLSVEEETTGE